MCDKYVKIVWHFPIRSHLWYLLVFMLYIVYIVHIRYLLYKCISIYSIYMYIIYYIYNIGGFGGGFWDTVYSSICLQQTLMTEPLPCVDNYPLYKAVLVPCDWAFNNVRIPAISGQDWSKLETCTAVYI